MLDITTAAGLDIHKRFIASTILSVEGTEEYAEFRRNIEGINQLKEWVVANNCNVVACESTNSFWYHIYDALHPVTNVIVGNAHDMKVVCHKKTDRIDSKNIAYLAMKGMIIPSRIFTKEQRDLRNLARQRQFTVQKRTDVKNRMHSVFDAEMFHTAQVFTDVFSVSGMIIISGMLHGDSPDEIFARLPRKVQETKRDEIYQLMSQTFSQIAIFQLEILVSELQHLNNDVKKLTDATISMARSLYPDEFKILTSVPGIGEISATILLAEIGNFNDFSSGDKLASWLGLVPKIYQSAGHSSHCSITKRGPWLARWILSQVAHAAARKKGSVFHDYYNERKGRIGTGKALVALARKIITIAWHLVVNKEEYVDQYNKPKKEPVQKSVRIPLTYSPERAMEIFAKAAALLKGKGNEVSDDVDDEVDCEVIDDNMVETPNRNSHYKGSWRGVFM